VLKCLRICAALEEDLLNGEMLVVGSSP